MLKKLRFRIILTIMVMSASVLAVAFCIIWGTLYSQSFEVYEQALISASESSIDITNSFTIGLRQNGRGDAGSSGAAGDISISFDTNFPQEHDLSSEQSGPASYDNGQNYIPIALVIVNASGSIIESNQLYSAMDTSTREEATRRAWTLGSGTGVFDDLNVFYLVQQRSNNEFIIAFADSTAFLISMRSTFAGLLLIILGTLIALFLVSVGLSYFITRPVQRAWDQQAEFISDASHELKTPLTVVLADTDIIASHPELSVSDQMKWVEGIQEEARHMKGLVEELLFLARSDEVGQVRKTEESIDLSAIVQESCLTFDAVAFEAGVNIEEDIQEGICIAGDSTQIQRLVKSLLDNAIKYAGNGGNVRVVLQSKKKGHATYAVNNTGPIIPAEELPRVFDRFWRSDSARTRTQQGSSYGLGLAIAKSIAEAQGGSISVTSSEEAGTTFTVEFKI